MQLTSDPAKLFAPSGLVANASFAVIAPAALSMTFTATFDGRITCTVITPGMYIIKLIYVT
jgi:hypothetical protein